VAVRAAGGESRCYQDDRIHPRAEAQPTIAGRTCGGAGECRCCGESAPVGPSGDSRRPTSARCQRGSRLPRGDDGLLAATAARLNPLSPSVAWRPSPRCGCRANRSGRRPAVPASWACGGGCRSGRPDRCRSLHGWLRRRREGLLPRRRRRACDASLLLLRRGRCARRNLAGESHSALDRAARGRRRPAVCVGRVLSAGGGRSRARRQADRPRPGHGSPWPRAGAGIVGAARGRDARGSRGGAPTPSRAVQRQGLDARPGGHDSASGRRIFERGGNRRHGRRRSVPAGPEPRSARRRADRARTGPRHGAVACTPAASAAACVTGGRRDARLLRTALLVAPAAHRRVVAPARGRPDRPAGGFVSHRCAARRVHAFGCGSLR
jgi:hypothetical protein